MPQHCGNYGILPRFFRKKSSIHRFTKELYYTYIDLTGKNLHGSEFLVFPHCVRTNYGNYRILLPRFLQNFRQINVLLKKFTINWFDGKRFVWQWISPFSTLHCVLSTNTQCGKLKNLLANGVIVHSLANIHSTKKFTVP